MNKKIAKYVKITTPTLVIILGLSLLSTTSFGEDFITVKADNQSDASNLPTENNPLSDNSDVNENNPSSDLSEAATTKQNNKKNTLYFGGNIGLGHDGWRRLEGSHMAYGKKTIIQTIKKAWSMAYGLHIGYQFNPDFALEAGYYSIKNNQIKWQTNNPDQSSINHNYFNIAGKMFLPLAKIGLYASAGATYAKENIDQPINKKPTQWMPSLGIGDEYSLSDSLSIGINFNHSFNLKKQKDDNFIPSLNLLTLSIDYHPPTKA